MACYIQYKDIFQLTHNPKMFKSSKCSKIFHNFSCQNSHILISQLKWVFLHVQISQEHVQISQEQEIQVQISQGQIFQVQISQGQIFQVKISQGQIFQAQISQGQIFQGQIFPFKFFQGQKSPGKYARQTQVKVKSGLVVPLVI